MMSNVIYLITDPNKKTYPHKVGKHTGTLNDLKSRYRTYNPNHAVLLFIETNNAGIVEDKVKEAFYYCREVNDKGNRSEWLDCDINIVKKYILDQCIHYTKEYSWSYRVLCEDRCLSMLNIIYNADNVVDNVLSEQYRMKAMKLMVEYIKRTYKIRYNYVNIEHGYSLSKNKIITLCRACYNIVSDRKGYYLDITCEELNKYEMHVKHIIGN